TTTKRERDDYRPTRLEALATCALERAGVEPYCDPLSIALGLGRTVRAVTRAEARATLVGNCLNYLWVQGATRETNMNILWGDALIVFADAGIVRPSPGELALVAGYLALPARGVDPVDEIRRQTYPPVWFLREHQKRRNWFRRSDSGLFAAVNR